MNYELMRIIVQDLDSYIRNDSVFVENLWSIQDLIWKQSFCTWIYREIKFT